jgi:hypothetical protein
MSWQALKREHVEDVADVLNDVATFTGKSSVEVQHITNTLWHGRGKE